MAPTPVSAATPQIEQHILTADNECVITDSQLSTQLLKYIRNNSELGPDDAALINGDNGKIVTFRQFLESSVKIAQGLRNLGVVPGDSVTLLARNMQYTNQTISAIYFNCVLLHPMFPYLEPELVAEQLHTVRPRVVFTESFALNRIRAGIKGMSPKPRIVVMDSDTVEPGMMTMEDLLRLGSNVDVDSFEEEHLENPEQDDVLLIFTTGSTGPPKPVLHTGRGLQALVQHLNNAFEENTKVLSLPFVSWITGQGSYLTAIRYRSTMVYSPEMTLDKQAQFLNEYDIRSYVGSPFTAVQLAHRGPFPTTLKRLIIGGSPMRHMTESKIRKALAPDATIMPVYGSTETGSVATMPYGLDRATAVGRLCCGVQMQVRDIRTGRPVAANEKGEIFIRTPATMKGYMDRPQQTKEVVDENNWVRSGDFGYFDDEGFVYIMDRIKDLIFYKDNIILPSELMDKISLHPDVLDSAVAPLPHPEDNHHAVAFVSLKPGKSVTEEEINKHIESLLGETHRLRGGVVFLERVPRTLSGKVASTDLAKKVQQMVET